MRKKEAHERAVRTNISLPPELKRRMGVLGGRINWSQIAADAFLAVVELAERTESQRSKRADCRP